MFDFQKLEVYKKAKLQHQNILILISNSVNNKTVRDQLSRASISIILNIAEGSGRFTNADKKNFYIIARSSVFECVSIMEILFENKLITENVYKIHLDSYEEISKMLYGLIKSLR